MARVLASFLFVLVCVMQLQAQVRISQAEVPEYAPWRAGIASLMVPGLGQRLQGNQEYARMFFLAEASMWAVFLGSYTAQGHYLSSALDHVGRYAGATEAPRDEEFLQLIGEYQSRSGSAGHNSSPDIGEDYNQDLLRSNLSLDHQFPNTAKYQWDWGSSDDPSNNQKRRNYDSILRKYRMSKIIYQSSIGLLILNRVVSAIHALRDGKSATVVSQSQWILDPQPSSVKLSWVRKF